VSVFDQSLLNLPMQFLLFLIL